MDGDPTEFRVFSSIQNGFNVFDACAALAGRFASLNQ